LLDELRHATMDGVVVERVSSQSLEDFKTLT
jgi:hypothetical protein